jgi:4-amino-4-deoxy-L-arabinose transferase-like glycosyltransferase
MLIQGTTFTYFRTSSWLLTDVVFTSLISLSTLAFTVRIVWARYSARWLAVGYGALALACLAKSPLLAPFFVGATVLVFLVLQYGLRRIGSELRQLQIPIGLAAVLAVVLPWYVIMVVRHGGSFLSVSFLDQHFGRLMGAESHQRPIWYYLRSLPGDFLPWSFFLPLAIFYGHARFSRPAEKVLMVWALVVFVALTLVSSKQGKYLLPMWTPLAVLVAAGFMDAEPESIWESYLGAGVLRVFPWLLRGLALVGLVAAACIWTDMIPERLRQAPRDALFASQGFQVRFLVIVGLTAAGLFSGAWFTARELRKRETLRALYGVSASLAFLFAAGTFLYGDLNTVKSGRNFATVVKETTGGQPLAIYAARRPGLLVYMIERTVPVLELLDSTGENPEPKASMARYIESPEERFLLIDQDYRKKFEGDFPSLAHKLRPVASGHVGSRRVYWLLSNRVQ